MRPLTSRQSLLLFVTFIFAMVATRSHHFASSLHLPDASLALFFLAGFYLRRLSAMLVLSMVAAVIDYIAITHQGVSSFCVTTAYPFLFLGYAALWYAGRWSATLHAKLSKVPVYAVAASLGLLTSYLFSNGSFYLLSGYVTDPSLTGYLQQAAHYLKGYFTSPWLYWVIAALIHSVIVMSVAARQQDAQQHS